jgi:hypothetical protein
VPRMRGLGRITLTAYSREYSSATEVDRSARQFRNTRWAGSSLWD